jgi:hypothetical protein
MKHIFQAVTITLLAAFSFAACSKKVEIKPEQSKVETHGLGLQVNWLKDKGSKFDLELAVSNNTGKDIVINLGDISCFRGTSQGMLKHTFFNTGERVMDFRSGQMKIFRLVCTMGGKPEGDFRILINNVYENSNGDGSSTGKVLLKKVEWKAAAAAAAAAN